MVPRRIGRKDEGRSSFKSDKSCVFDFTRIVTFSLIQRGDEPWKVTEGDLRKRVSFSRAERFRIRL